MFRKLKTFLQTFIDAVKVAERLEQHMVIQDRKIKLLEQRQDEVFNEVLEFIEKKKALDGEEKKDV